MTPVAMLHVFPSGSWAFVYDIFIRCHMILLFLFGSVSAKIQNKHMSLIHHISLHMFGLACKNYTVSQKTSRHFWL